MMHFFKQKQTPLEEETIHLCQKWKREIEINTRWIDDRVGLGEAIICNAKCLDPSPDINRKTKEYQPLRVGLVGFYHRGLQAGLSIEGLNYDKRGKGWRLSDYRKKENPDLNVYLIGLIPFLCIVQIDWEVGEHYRIPHIYCKFIGRNRGPYEDLVFCEKRWLDKHVYYTEIAKFQDVITLTERVCPSSFRLPFRK
jgi:hypothetical protein